MIPGSVHFPRNHFGVKVSACLLTYAEFCHKKRLLFILTKLFGDPILVLSNAPMLAPSRVCTTFWLSPYVSLPTEYILIQNLIKVESL